MPDTITVALEFDFRGEHHALRSRIDIAPYLRKGGSLPDLHRLLARDHGFDLYSYEYELMQMETPRIIDAEGLAREYLREGRLDWEGLRAAVAECREHDAIRAIARRLLDIDDLHQQPRLRDALLAAYRAGRDATLARASSEGD